MKRKARLNQRGVTLIELLAVVVILGILAAIAVPAVFKGFDDAKENAKDTTEKVLINAAKQFIIEKGGFAKVDESGDDDWKGDNSKKGTVELAIATLINGGYLDDGEYKNPVTDNKYTKVRIVKDSNSNKYTYTVQ